MSGSRAGPRGVRRGPPDAPLRRVISRFVRNRLAMAALVALVVVLVGALAGGHLWHYRFTFQSPDNSQPPSWRHPFGTDGLGRDTLAMVLRGANKSVTIALLVAGLSTAFGTLVGAVAGLYRGWVDAVLMRGTDLALTIPTYAAAATLAYRFGSRANGWVYLALVLAGFAWMPVARVVRGTFLALREREYVEAARAMGAGGGRIILRHLLPNAIGPIIVNGTLVAAAALLAEAALSYIGLGIQPPDTSLGQLVAGGQQAIATRPWLFYFPGLVIVVIVLSINFVGDGLRDAFDPAGSGGS